MNEKEIQKNAKKGKSVENENKKTNIYEKAMWKNAISEMFKIKAT